MTDGCLKQIVTKFQEAAFFKITMKRQWEKHGLVIICKSAQMSKFKLVLFDKDGGVRTIQVRFFLQLKLTVCFFEAVWMSLEHFGWI